MAFPTVASRTTTGITAASNSHTVNLDAANADGDLLVMISRHAAPTVTVVNVPTGWAKDIDTTQAGTSQDRIVFATKRLTAGDAEIGASSMNVTFTGGSAKSGYIVFRITGAHDTSNPEYSTVATGASTTPDPASRTASWGAEDNLWIWAGTWEGEQTSPPASNPTSYTNPTGASSGTAGAVDTNCRVATAERNNAVATENPGSWTISVTDDWAAYTIAVRPAGAAPVTLTPGAITALGAMVAPAVNVVVPIVASLAAALAPAPTVDISSGLTLSPAAIVATASTPAPTVHLLAQPPPVVSAAATGTPTVLARVVPAAIVATAATGAPVTAVLKAVTPNIATASSPATVVRVVVPLTAPIAIASTPAPFVIGEGLVVPATAIIATAATGIPVVLSSVQATAIVASAGTPAQTVRVLIPLTALVAVASTGSAAAITGALNVAAAATIVSNIPTPATVAPADSPAATISSDGTITAIVADLVP